MGLERGTLAAAFLVVAVSAICPSEAKMGYDIIASVDSTTWELHRSILNTTFSDTSYASGTGTFQKYSSIDGFVGVEAKERWSSSNGTLGFAEQQLLTAREGPVYIKINAQEVTIPDEEKPEEEEKRFVTRSSAEITVDEYWRAFYGNNKRISYKGKGIRGAETFNNNGDVVATRLDSWKLTRESGYQAVITRTMIDSSIKPGSLDVDLRQNRSTRFKLGMSSIGVLSHLGVMRQEDERKYGRISNNLAIYEDYMGQHTITLNITMGQSFRQPDLTNIPWLECCFGGDVGGGSESWRPPQWDGSRASSDRIFSAEP
ncbi:MAG: hypothetical protein QFX31_04485 [Methanothrix sp.]|uniref:hypothetical protein n=1 Tax=Methanothrix sp. TaxID=90426 RepID=UPI00317CE80D|nr:hypothetical protein [Methanothrix sp.]